MIADGPETTAINRGLLNEIFNLLRDVERAVIKMGLCDRGDDLRLSHEVRMLALKFSPASANKVEQLGASFGLVTGDGTSARIRQQIKEA